LEIIPNIGPTIAAIPAVLIAYFQGSTYLPLSNGWFALLVIGLYVVIQQLENNILVPRIIGRSLNLHPLVVIIGAIAGASLAGVLGMFLAAPILASLRTLGNYVNCKLLDLEPFDEHEASSSPVQENNEEPEPMREEEGETD
jgi:predicted PurR-regulated permease PerM